MTGWNTVRLGDILATPLSNGRSVPTLIGGFPVLRLTAIRQGSIDLAERKEGAWTREDASKFLVQRGDFLVARGNGSLDLVGRGGLVDSEPDEVAFPDTMIRIRPDITRILPRFLSLAWSSPAVRAQIRSLARTTAGIYKVNQSHLAGIRFSVPSIADQRRIIDILDEHLSHLDSGTSLVSLCLRRLFTLRMSVLAELHSGEPVDLGCLSSESGYGTSEKCVVGGPGPAVVRIPNLIAGRIDLSDEKRIADPQVHVAKYALQPGDILIVRTNGSVDLIGRSAIVQPGIDAAFASYIIRYRVDEERVRPAWVQAMLSTPQVRARIEPLAASSAGQLNLSLAKLDSLTLPIPPLPEQDTGLRRLADIDANIDRLRGALATARIHAEHLRSSLLTAAFAGHLTNGLLTAPEPEELVGA